MNRFVKILACVALMIAILTNLWGCQQSPTTQSVVSKNDGSFDSRVIEPADERQRNDSSLMIEYMNQFTSTDGTVMFTFNINEQYAVQKNSVSEVAPHFLTEADVKRIATALLGDVEWFVQEPRLEPKYTKEQIQEKISRWSLYTNSETITELLARESAYTDSVVANVKRFIEKYSNCYETAPTGTSQKCEWRFKKESYSQYSKETLAGQDLSKENDSIYAVTKVGDVEYTLSAATRNMNDFKLNNIYLYLGEGISPSSIDSAIFRAKLCRTAKPTDENIAAVEAKAKKILKDIDLGDWKVDSTSVHTTYYGDTPEYTINVSAVPVINEGSAVRVPQIANLKSTAAYASNYYMTDAYFQFSPDGKLVRFGMVSPIDIKNVVNENVATKSIDELMELSKKHLMLSDYYEYGLSRDYLEQIQKDSGEKLTCQVEICKMDYGMLRVKVPNTDESYYYVPGIVLSGTVDYIGNETGNVYASSGETIWNERIIPLVALNAVDGSVVELYIS